ncbi:NAD(P)H-dependent oxidoreductase [Streptomyces sp. NPDC046977]|uniref:flavodoxin family protein n=1 Tax=Streptomyces sp. NPDC046977 TaxID=3154703 RepID=UPI0033CBCC49
MHAQGDDGLSETERTFLFLVGSTRAEGNTETLARRAAEQLPASVGRRWMHLRDLPLPLFEDHRHDGDGSYPPPTGHAAELLDATLRATDLVIVSPLHWYTVSTSVKLYLDHWSGWMRVPGVDFLERMRGKTLWSVTVHGGQDPATAAPLVGTLRHTAAYAGMRWGGALLGNGTRPGDVLRDTAALGRAKAFFA